MNTLADLFAQLYGDYDANPFDVRRQTEQYASPRTRLVDLIRSEFLAAPARRRLGEVWGGQTVPQQIQEALAQALGGVPSAPDMTAMEEFRSPVASQPESAPPPAPVPTPAPAPFAPEPPPPQAAPGPAPIVYEPRPRTPPPPPRGNIGGGVISTNPSGGSGTIGNTSGGGTSGGGNIGSGSGGFGAIGSSSQKKKK